MSKTIAIANEKGGVAKTTTALSLGGALSLRGYRVALFDLDAQANLTLSLNIRPDNTETNITDVLFNEIDPGQALLQSGVENLFILPSHSGVGLAEQKLPGVRDFPSTILNLIPDLADMDYIVMDCPPAVGSITLAALIAADLLLIPTVADYFSVFALKKILGIISKVNSYRSKPLLYRVLITQLDLRLGSQKTIFKELKNRLRKNLAKSVIPTDAKVRECPKEGLPITHYKKSSRASIAYKSLAEEVVEIIQS